MIMISTKPLSLMWLTTNAATAFDGITAIPTARRPVVASLWINWLTAAGTWNFALITSIFGIVIPAQSLGPSRFSTNRTFRFTPSTIPTKSQFVFAYIKSYSARLSAFITFSCKPSLFVPHLIVMFNTKAMSKMRKPASFTFLSGSMVQIMSTQIWKKLKITYTIIVGFFISMMHHFGSCKVSAKVLFHHQAMLENVSSAICRRMFWSFYFDVTFAIKLVGAHVFHSGGS